MNARPVSILLVDDSEDLLQATHDFLVQPDVVVLMANSALAAQQSDPSVLDRVGSYGAQHPPIIKMLGGAVLAIALGQIAPRMKT